MATARLASSPEMRRGLLRWLALAAVVIVLDQITKEWVIGSFRLGESLVVTSFFNLVLVLNPGASFSFLAGAGGWQKWFFIVLALGNVIDRLRFDAVVDFLDFHLAGYHWPAFNVADSAITVGVVLMLLQQWRQPKESS